MATVPTSGAWQSDPVLQRLRKAAVAARDAFQPTGRDMQPQAVTEYLRYVSQNRQRLGIPKGYYPDVNTGQLVDGSVPWIKMALALGSAAAGPLVAPVLAASAAVPAATGISGAVAPAVTTAAHTASWLAPALNYGIPAATGLLGAKMQSYAERDAARLQTDYLNRALDVEKEKEQYQRGQRADYLGRLAPYNQAGTAAVGRANDLLTTSRYRPEGTMSGVAQGGAMVALKDSQGIVRQVPASEADRYLQLGAVRA